MSQREILQALQQSKKEWFKVKDFVSILGITRNSIQRAFRKLIERKQVHMRYAYTERTHKPLWTIRYKRKGDKAKIEEIIPWNVRQSEFQEPDTNNEW